MKNKIGTVICATIVAVVAMLALAGLMLFALSKGHDGQLLMLTCSGITGLAGIFGGWIFTKRKSDQLLTDALLRKGRKAALLLFFSFGFYLSGCGGTTMDKGCLVNEALKCAAGIISCTRAPPESEPDTGQPGEE